MELEVFLIRDLEVSAILNGVGGISIHLKVINGEMRQCIGNQL